MGYIWVCIILQNENIILINLESMKYNSLKTKEELDALRNMGITMIQGFYFERPLEADIIRREFPQKIRRDVVTVQ